MLMLLWNLIDAAINRKECEIACYGKKIKILQISDQLKPGKLAVLAVHKDGYSITT